MRETFRPQERIRKKPEFSVLYRDGQRARGKYFILIHLPGEMKFSRMSVVVSRKHGNAVRRNRTKRQARTLFRRNKDLLMNPMDFLIIPKREWKEADWSELESAYRKAAQSISMRTCNK